MYVDNFQDLLAWVKNNRLASIETVTIDLSTARTDELLEVAGLVIYAENATDATASLQIRHNELSSGLITLTKSYGQVYPFYRLYLTNAAQASKTITLTIGRASPYAVIDNRSGQDMLSAIQDLLEEAQGPSTASSGGGRVQLSAEGVILAANTDRKSFGIHNPSGNGLLYLRFDNTAVTTTNFAVVLAAGETYIADDYRGIVRGLMATSGQYAHKWEI